MSRKTKKHKHSIHHKRHKRRYSHSHSMHHNRKTHRKRREISVVPGSKSIPMFTAPNKSRDEMISVNVKQSFGNIVPGLRNYMKNM